ncbi:MAG: sigma-54-dependent Fis family transcriptional regulator, partial [Deltaproteobacteria bacterium]|nr:sigma-54-dependent Fis family transcriptional regulator [Deltaproteobacteria bacterium]
YLELDSAFQKQDERATEIVRGRADKLREAYLQEVGLGDVLVYSDAFRAVIELAEKFSSDRSLPVLIDGESGTGKDVIARYIHYFSQGMTVTPFVAINCGAVAPGLFEAELFGHEAGAFTGATASGREGKLEAAQGGTVFLDEIGEMPAELQVKLLRVLESRRLYRVGGVKEIPIDVRIIAATNKDLSKEVQEDRFRLDLYYRLNVAHLRIPPLRERREDILPLALKFAASASARRGRPFGGFSSAGERYLSSLPWPGNVRQLKNAMERLALLGPWDCVDEEALSFIERFGLERVRPCEGGFVLGRDAFDLPEEGFDLDDLVKRIVSRALEKNHGNQTATASFLRLSRRVLQGKLQKRSGSAA